MKIDTVAYIALGLLLLGTAAYFFMRSRQKGIGQVVQNVIAGVVNEFSQFSWDAQDSRDLIFAPVTTSNLPVVVDPRPNTAPPMHQNGLNSCVAMAAVGALEDLQLRGGNALEPLSPLFAYWITRKAEWSKSGNKPVSIRNCLNALAKSGICSESAWPYDVAKLTVEPPPEAFADAATRKVPKYYRIDVTPGYSRLDGVRAALAEGHSVVFGLEAYDNIRSDRLAFTGGVLTVPGREDKFLGGHALKAIGYDDLRRVLICTGCAGPTWADHGTVYVDYGYVESQGLGHAFWVFVP